ncbi:MAG TPA: ATP-binding protein [Acidimicrobiales bacterium]|nr:ATP-binding protein [Acidimicrobiales bacterium]
MRTDRAWQVGTTAGLACLALFAAALLPLRQTFSSATVALALVVPVVVGVATGGFVAGALTVAAGFLVYDVAFIPPYGTLDVTSGEDWVALAVWAVVMLVVARVVARLRAARAESRRHLAAMRQLFELSDVLIAEVPLPELLERIVATVHQVFRPAGVALLLPGPEGIGVAAAAGEPLDDEQLRAATPSANVLRSVGASAGVLALPLSASRRPVGVLALAGARLDRRDWELLRTYGNQAALAIERGRLREQALRASLLEQVDRWRSALMGAVSHDLRTPLATVKAAVSDLRRRDLVLAPGETEELLALVEAQADRLARLVTNLLDMTRLRAGALEARREAVDLEDLVAEALATLASPAADRFVLSLPADLPPVDVDPVLVVQVFVNLLDNADRHAREASRVVVSACACEDAVEVHVADDGPGVPPGAREGLFGFFDEASGGGRSGLGLAIAEAFLEVHGQSMRLVSPPGGGAEFVFRLPVAPMPAEVG